MGNIYIADQNNYRVREIISSPLIATKTLPDGIAGVPYSQTLTAVGGKTPYSWSISGGSLPEGLTLAGTTGILSGVPLTTGTFTFSARVADVNGSTSLKNLTLTIYQPLTVTTASLSFGTVNTAYSQTVTATGGLQPYTTWSITAGTLPVGLFLYNTGVIAGTPTSAGTPNFTVQVRDANGTTNTKALSISIYNLLSITTKSISSGATGRSYSQTLAAAGGKTPYSWSISAGNLPSGLILNGSTGVLSGKPATSGSYSFTVRVTDANATTSTKAFSMTVR